MRISPILSALLRNKTGAVLVAVQVALSLAILANALHIVNVRQAVAARPSGIADESSVFYTTSRYLMVKESAQYDLAVQRREVEVLRAVPGVASVAYVTQMPMSDSGNNNSLSIDRKQVNASADGAVYRTAESLIDTLQLKLIEGRDFTPADVLEIDSQLSDEFPKTTIITKALADKLWPKQSAIGKTLYYGTGEDGTPTRVIGVVERLQSPWAQVDEEGEFSAAP